MNRYFGVHVLDGEWHALLPRYLVLSDRVEDQRILDIGCGTGIGSSMLLELGAERVDGVDYRPGVLDLANIKHAKESLDFHTMLWENLEFPDDTFDMVVCLDPTTPVTDPNLLDEVSRVLTDGGEYVCAIERRTIEGFESLLPRYGYSAPAENVELGDREEQAPQIGELTTHFDSHVRVLQRPEYSYLFEPESRDEGEELDQVPVDYTLCTEDSHIAGIELIFCGPEGMDEPGSTSIRLPYYRLAERLNTVIRDLNVRQGPGSGDSSLEGPVEAGPDRETQPQNPVREETTSTWGDESTNIQESPEPANRDDGRQPGLERELDRLNDAYRTLQRNFEQLREQTQAAMVNQERSIDRLIQMLRHWGEQNDVDLEAGADEGDPSPRAETDIYDATRVQDAVEAADDLAEAKEAASDEPPEDVERLRSERDDLRDEVEQLRDELEELRDGSGDASTDADEASDAEDASEASDDASEASDDED